MLPASFEYDNQIARQKIPGAYYVHKFGRNAAVTAAYTTLWTPAGLYVYRDTATIMTISSGSVDDVMTSGSGAWKVIILGLTTGHIIAQEEVELNGRTAVNTINAYLRVFRMKVSLAADANTFNAGIIYMGTGTVTTGVPAIIHAEIDAGMNQSQMAMMSIPVDTIGYLTYIKPTTAVVKIADVRMLVREDGGAPFQMKADPSFLANPFPDYYSPPIRLEAKSDIEFQARAAAGGGDVGVNFTVRLEPNNNIRPTFL